MKITNLCLILLLLVQSTRVTLYSASLEPQRFIIFPKFSFYPHVPTKWSIIPKLSAFGEPCFSRVVLGFTSTKVLLWLLTKEVHEIWMKFSRNIDNGPKKSSSKVGDLLDSKGILRKIKAMGLWWQSQLLCYVTLYYYSLYILRTGVSHNMWTQLPRKHASSSRAVRRLFRTRPPVPDRPEQAWTKVCVQSIPCADFVSTQSDFRVCAH